MDERLFCDAMGKFATGITIVTMDDNDHYIGMTVNAFMSISLNPKLIAISINEEAGMYDKLKNTDTFGVSILRKEQRDLSMIFAKQKEKDRDVEFLIQNEVPVIKNALATISCKVDQQVHAGDHLIIIAEVTDLAIQDGTPVLYYEGKYRTINPNDV